jgi:hypothetical protein
MDSRQAGNWIVAAQKHFQEFGVHRDLRHFPATLLAGKCGRLLNALRGAERITNPDEFEGIAADIGILPDDLYTAVLPTLEEVTGGRIEPIRDKKTGEITGVVEYPVAKGQVLDYTCQIWEGRSPKPTERIAIDSLEICSRLPQEIIQYKNCLAEHGFREQDIDLAVDLQNSFGLIRRVQLRGTGDSIVYAEYVWRENAHKIIHALRQMDYPQKQEMLDLVNSIVDQQGYPLKFLDSIPSEILELARRIGLIDVVRVSTTTKREEAFAFTPAMVGSLMRNELEKDLYDDVKAFVASLRFGMLFASGSSLEAPIRFLRKLIEAGEAGSAPAIGRDYKLPERRKIIKIVRVPGRYGPTWGMELLKRDVAERTLEVFEYQKTLALEERGERTSDLDPSTFASPEADRIRLERAPTAREPLGSELADRLFLQVLRGER